MNLLLVTITVSECKLLVIKKVHVLEYKQILSSFILYLRVTHEDNDTKILKENKLGEKTVKVNSLCRKISRNLQKFLELVSSARPNDIRQIEKLMLFLYTGNEHTDTKTKNAIRKYNTIYSSSEK